MRTISDTLAPFPDDLQIFLAEIFWFGTRYFRTQLRHAGYSTNSLAALVRAPYSQTAP